MNFFESKHFERLKDDTYTTLILFRNRLNNTFGDLHQLYGSHKQNFLVLFI